MKKLSSPLVKAMLLVLVALPLMGFGECNYTNRYECSYRMPGEQHEGCEVFGDFGYGVKITPTQISLQPPYTQVFQAVLTLDPPKPDYRIKWYVKGASILKEWGDHNQIAKININDPNAEILAELVGSNYRDTFHLKYHTGQTGK